MDSDAISSKAALGCNRRKIQIAFEKLIRQRTNEITLTSEVLSDEHPPYTHLVLATSNEHFYENVKWIQAPFSRFTQALKIKLPYIFIGLNF